VPAKQQDSKSRTQVAKRHSNPLRNFGELQRFGVEFCCRSDVSATARSQVSFLCMTPIHCRRGQLNWFRIVKSSGRRGSARGDYVGMAKARPYPDSCDARSGRGLNAGARVFEYEGQVGHSGHRVQPFQIRPWMRRGSSSPIARALNLCAISAVRKAALALRRERWKAVKPEFCSWYAEASNISFCLEARRDFSRRAVV
jgi:hypothetical protein